MQTPTASLITANDLEWLMLTLLANVASVWTYLLTNVAKKSMATCVWLIEKVKQESNVNKIHKNIVYYRAMRMGWVFIQFRRERRKWIALPEPRC